MIPFGMLTQAELDREEQPGTGIKDWIERFVCQLYLPRTDITTVKELRQFLFRKKQAESDRLPPTQAALHQAILRAHFQLMVWNKDTEPNHVLPSPSDYGWAMENAEWVPVMTTLSPAPEAVMELVKCGCSKEEMCNQSMPRELGYCEWTCVAVMTRVNARASMTMTSISMIRKKVMRTSVVMREGLRNDLKYVCFFLGYFKTIDFHGSLLHSGEWIPEQM